MGDYNWRELFLDSAREGRLPTVVRGRIIDEVDNRQPSGRLTPVFVGPTDAEEEAYIEIRIQLDREADERGY